MRQNRIIGDESAVGDEEGEIEMLVCGCLFGLGVNFARIF
jgi:hypothetical protein